MTFFPRKLGHHPTLTKLIFFRFSSPHSPSYDFESLMQLAYGVRDKAVENYLVMLAVIYTEKP